MGEYTVTQQDARNLLRRGTGEDYAEVDFIDTETFAYRTRWSVRRARRKADGSLQKNAMSLKQLPDLQHLGGTKKSAERDHPATVLSLEQFTSDVLLAQNEFSIFLKSECSRRLNIDPPCRSNIDPGRVADFRISNCG